jgi:DNA invertase Pin-like site-specific DNA recombinase
VGYAFIPYDRKSPPSRLIGYARVSTYDRSLDAQLGQLKVAGCAWIFQEKATSSHADRKELLRILKQLGTGDVVVVTRIDRLARSTFDRFAIVKQIANADARVRSLTLGRYRHQHRPPDAGRSGWPG